MVDQWTTAGTFGPGPNDEVDDGFGNHWLKCSDTCDMQVVRPGRVQCSCEDAGES